MTVFQGQKKWLRAIFLISVTLIVGGIIFVTLPVFKNGYRKDQKENSTSDTLKFSIVQPQELDSMGTDSWKAYLDRKKLLDAWSPPKGSPYSDFVKTKVIDSVESIGPQIKPRYSEGEETSEQEITNLINGGAAREQYGCYFGFGWASQYCDGG